MLPGGDPMWIRPAAARKPLKGLTARQAARYRERMPAGAWEHWQVPFDVDADWPEALRGALRIPAKITCPLCRSLCYARRHECRNASGARKVQRVGAAVGSNARDAYGPQRKPARLAAGGITGCRGDRAVARHGAGRREGVGFGHAAGTAGGRCRGFVPRAVVARRWRSATRVWSRRWSTCSTRSHGATRRDRCAGHAAARTRLAEQLGAEGHRASERTVNRLLHELGYSLQANRKTLEGRQHPDRDAQFRRIARRVRAFQRLGQPVARSTRRRRSWSADTATAAGNGVRRAAGGR